MIYYLLSYDLHYKQMLCSCSQVRHISILVYLLWMLFDGCAGGESMSSKSDHLAYAPEYVSFDPVMSSMLGHHCYLLSQLHRSIQHTRSVMV